MFRKDDTWYSEFPPNQRNDQVVKFDAGGLAVTSYDNLTGGHAAIYLEFVDDKGAAHMWKLHMRAGLDGSEQKESTGSGSSGSSSPGSGLNQIFVLLEEKEVNGESGKRGESLVYQSFVVTNAEIDAVLKEARKFEARVADGKYVYRLAGGRLGKISTLPGQRGVNCADFCIGVLEGARIANLEDKLFNTPRRVAGG